MEEKVLFTILFFAIAVPVLLLFFFSVKKKVTKWYYKGLLLASGYYTNRKIYSAEEKKEYIEYNNKASRWVYTYVFPTIYRFLIVFVPVFLLCVRIPTSNGYILRSNEPATSKVCAVFDVDSFELKTGYVSMDQKTGDLFVDDVKTTGIMLGEYIEKEVTIYTFPEIVVRSIVATTRVFIDNCIQLLEKIY